MPGISALNTTALLRRGGASALQTLLSKFTYDGTGSVILHRGVSPTSIYVGIGIGNEAVLCTLPTADLWVEGASEIELIDMSQAKIMGGIYAENCTRYGSWSSGAVANNYSGKYYRTSANGAYIETTTPAGVTEIGIWSTANANCGIQIVSIDGDNTLANLLPTAQDLVNDGSIADTCLVANGGTLNPTDRIFDLTDPLNTSNFYLYTITNNIKIRVASGLTAGAHTIRITNTPYLPAGASTAYLRINGFYWDDPAAVISDCPVSSLSYESTEIDPINSDSDQNFAFSFKPTGASGYEWIGHSDSCKNKTITIYVDDVEQSLPATGGYLYGSEIKISVTSEGFHTEEVSKVLDISQDLIFNATSQLTVNSTFTWLIAGQATGYNCQLGANNTLDKGAILEDSSDYVLTSDNDTVYGNIAGSAAYMWDADGEIAAVLSINAYTSTPLGVIQIIDRSDSINKAYFRLYNSADISINDQNVVIVNYRLKRFSDGANTNLARP